MDKYIEWLKQEIARREEQLERRMVDVKVGLERSHDTTEINAINTCLYSLELRSEIKTLKASLQMAMIADLDIMARR